MSTPLISETLVIKNPQGLHARPAEMLARTAMQFEAKIELVNSAQRVDAKSILHILTLGADQGTQLLLEARGVDARQAVEALVQLVEGNFTDDGTLSQEQAGEVLQHSPAVVGERKLQDEPRSRLESWRRDDRHGPRLRQR